MSNPFSSDSRQPQIVTQKSSNEPPDFQKPFITKGLHEAERLYDSQAPEYFPGQTFVPFSPETETALDQQAARAQGGNPLNPAAQSVAFDTLGGAYLGGNPFFQGAFDAQVRPMVEQYTQQIAPGIDSSFAGAGRYGSNAYATARNTADESFGRALADTAGKLAYQNYDQERGRQQEAMGIAPQLANIDYTDIQQLANVGAAREAQAGTEMQADINRFNFEQQKPFDKLAQYMALISGGYGSQGTTTQPVFSSPGASFLGGAATGAGIGNMIGGGTGAAVGAGLGGLLGL